jgi:hypothetical protein
MDTCAPLRRYLESIPKSTAKVTMTFEEFSRIAPNRAGHSMRTHRPWWANQRAAGWPQSEAWMGAGWEVDTVDQKAEVVTFRQA